MTHDECLCNEVVRIHRRRVHRSEKSCDGITCVLILTGSHAYGQDENTYMVCSMDDVSVNMMEHLSRM